jgi:hypothetical protein
MVRLLKYFRFSKKLSVIFATLKRAAPDLFYLLIVALTVSA